MAQGGPCASLGRRALERIALLDEVEQLKGKLQGMHGERQTTLLAHKSDVEAMRDAQQQACPRT